MRLPKFCVNRHTLGRRKLSAQHLMRISVLPFLLLLVLPVGAHSKIIANLRVELDKSTGGLAIPTQVVLDDITWLPAEQLQLLEMHDANHGHPVAIQVSGANPRILNWLIEPDAEMGSIRKYRLIQIKAETAPPTVSATPDGTIMTLHNGDRPLLSYHYAVKEAPEGQKYEYRRSGFIHPLYSPSGHVLTSIQPEDHYHHYGIWNPWTKVEFEGEKLDFWNIAGGDGTVRFAKFISSTNGSVFGEYKALHEHVVFDETGPEKIALNELQSVRIYQPKDKSYYIADVTIEYNCPTESAFNIIKHRYAGFGWRATPLWNSKDNTNVLSSEGKTRKDIDGSTARWCIVEGELEKDYGGVVMMSYPTNYNHPEPLRIWPLDEEGKGDMFANFATTKTTDWHLNPGNTYVLKYRLLVYDGKSAADKAEAAWQYFASPPTVSISKE